MSARDPRNAGVDALAVKRGALPFLPTLVTAIAVAALSLLCRTPAPVPAAVETAAVAAARAGSDGFHPAMEAASAETLPAALAFARHRPLALQAMAGEEARPARPARATAARTAPAARACTGGRCGETRRTETARNAPPPAAVRPAPEATTGAVPPPPLRPRPAPETDEDDLPAGALPFVPAAAWADGVRRFGRDVVGGVAGEAASLGGAVKDLSLSSASLPAALPASLPTIDLLALVR